MRIGDAGGDGGGEAGGDAGGDAGVETGGAPPPPPAHADRAPTANGTANTTPSHLRIALPLFPTLCRDNLGGTERLQPEMLSRTHHNAACAPDDTVDFSHAG